MPRTLSQHLQPDGGPKRILALDGGGVRGVLSLGILAELEKELRRRANDDKLVLSDYYDLIGGTSTGAIIATGLAMGQSVDNLAADESVKKPGPEPEPDSDSDSDSDSDKSLMERYRKQAPKVFKRKRGLPYSRTGFLWKPVYDHDHLEKVMGPVMGDARLGDSEHSRVGRSGPHLRTGLSIHMKRLDTGSAWVVSNHPASPYFEQPSDGRGIPNKEFRLSDLVHASAAAPIYFDEYAIPTERDENGRPLLGSFLDGAVGANHNPGLQLLLTAIVRQYGFGWSAGADNLMMTSIGTGLRRPRVRKSRWRPGAVRAGRAFEAMIYDTQLQGVAVLQALSSPRVGWFVNTEVGDMAGGPFTNEAVLDYQRIDVSLELPPSVERIPWRPRWVEHVGLSRFRVPEGGRERAPVEALLGEDCSLRAIDDLADLANGDEDNVKLLEDIGRAAGRRYVNESYPDPKFDLPEWRQG